MRRIHVLLILPAALIAAFPLQPSLNRGLTPVIRRLRGKKTVGDRVHEYGEAARARLAPHFAAAGVGYPPAQLVLLGLKAERELQLYAGTEDLLRFVRSYPIVGASASLYARLAQEMQALPVAPAGPSGACARQGAAGQNVGRLWAVSGGYTGLDALAARDGAACLCCVGGHGAVPPFPADGPGPLPSGSRRFAANGQR